MGITIIKHIRKKFVEAFPDKFAKLTDLPILKIYKTLRDKGIPEDEIKLIGTAARFDFTIKTAGINLDGLVLDLCSGSISIASIYNPDKVVCYDFLNEVMDGLRDRDFQAVQADISDMNLYREKKRYFPFKNKAFDYLYCEGLPMLPYRNPESPYNPQDLSAKNTYLKNIVKEIIRVTKNYAIMSSSPLLNMFPKEYSHRLKVKHTKQSIFVIDCRKNYKKKKSNKKDEL